jgi:uncharacterized protein (DUF1697 family)
MSAPAVAPRGGTDVALHGALHVALFRGINVGTAKAVAMPQLAAVFEALGYTVVRTVLRSGNVVFGVATDQTGAAERIEAAVLAATGVQSSVLVLTATKFRAIAEANPLDGATSAGVAATGVPSAGSKTFITFLSEPHGTIEVPDAAALAPELLRVGDSAVYQWMPDGSQQTKVPKSFWKQFSGHVTARNANTVRKLLDLLEA